MKNSTLNIKRFLLSMAFICSITFGFGQTKIAELTFEIAGGYTTSILEFTGGLGNSDYFIRTNGANTSGNFLNIQGAYYFAAQDIDANGDPLPLSFLMDDVNITGYTNLELRVHLAEDDEGANEDWDNADYVHFNYDIDNTGAFSNLLWIENDGTGFNTEPSIDTDYNGIGDGAVITDTFTQFTQNIAGIGALVDIEIVFNFNSGEEDIAIDNIEIWGIANCLSTSAWDGANWTPPAGPDLTIEAILNANYDTATFGSFSACNLTVSPTSRLTVNNLTYVEVENDITIDAGGELWVETQGALVQNGDLSTFTDNSINGLLVTKMTTPLLNWFDYTYWSSPVVDETVGTALAFSNPDNRFWFNAVNYLDVQQEIANTNTFIAGNDDIDDNGDDWQLANAADVMTPGVGFAATHDNVGFVSGNQYAYTFYGAMNNGVITTPIAFNGVNGDNDWNFIGNPYPCAIDSGIFFSTNARVIGGAAYLWSHNTVANGNTSGNEGQNYSQADYALILSSGVNVAGGDGVQPTNYIASGQGFFVQGLANSTVTFNNSMRMADITSNDQFFRSAATQERNVFWMNLTSDNGIFNQIAVGYLEGATNGDDGMGYDATKNLASGNAAIIYSLIESDNRKYAVQCKHPNSLAIDEVVSLGFNNSIEEDTQFTLSIAQMEGDFMNGNTIYLKDNLLDGYYNLSASDYTFTSEIGEFKDRFEIRFSNTLSIDEFNLNTNELLIVINNDKGLDVSTSQQSKIANIKVYDLLGRQLKDLDTDSKTMVSLNTNTMSNSVYIAKVTLANGRVLTKKILK